MTKKGGLQITDSFTQNLRDYCAAIITGSILSESAASIDLVPIGQI